jgi:adenine-specific DNA methylase
MLGWAKKGMGKASAESSPRLVAIEKNPRRLDDPFELRSALLDFIADFADWDHANDPDYLATARALVQAAHEALGGSPGTRPLVVDPFAGGGAIPLEALRVGADAFASDLNPVAVLLEKVLLESIPKYGKRLADEVRRWGNAIQAQAEGELGQFYPCDPDGSVPVAYLWSRTFLCEGPECGAEVPLIRSLWLAKRRGIALKLAADAVRKRIVISIADDATDRSIQTGTVSKGAAVCPICSYKTKNARIRLQLSQRRGGASDARLIAVVLARKGDEGRIYRLPTEADTRAVEQAAVRLNERERSAGQLSFAPNEPVPSERPSPNARGLSAVTRMGVKTFGDLFTPRQKLALATFTRMVAGKARKTEEGLNELETCARACLALAVDRMADYQSSLASWSNTGEFTRSTFARQALAIVWDFSECNAVRDGAGSWTSAVESICRVIENLSASSLRAGQAVEASATDQVLFDDGVDALITDPPYYDAVPYADVSLFFYVWLRRSLADAGFEGFARETVPTDEEATWNPSRLYSKTGKPKDERFYEDQMRRAFSEGRRVTRPSGVGTIVFAHKTTAGWEAVLAALVAAGWTVTASWPIDTERSTRTNAIGTASLGSSVHIVCRPRENPDGSLRDDLVGDWRDVLAELPQRVHEWLPRLAAEGIEGADAIFACLGPALEIFSRYSRVERASGEVVPLREYLEHVWAAVAKEALSMLFEGADASGFEPDARLTAMWLWTLGAGSASTPERAGDDPGEEEGAEDEDESEAAAKSGGRRLRGFVLEYDAARKIAQGLGADLDRLGSLVEAKGESARLLPLSDRVRHLFGVQAPGDVARRERRRKPAQRSLFAELEEAEVSAGGRLEAQAMRAGETVLDRLHQAMILFQAGRGEALRRFLVDEGAGRDPRFWKLAQSLNALYPRGSDERRCVEGVLARRKGLGL